MRGLIAAGLGLFVVSGVSPACAQLEASLDPMPEEAAADPSAGDPAALDPEADDISDADVIRWASREVGREDGRAVGEHPPIPPDEYLRRSRNGPQPIFEADPAGDVLRVLAETGMGTLIGGAGGALGGLLIWAMFETGADGRWTAIAVAAGASAGALSITSGVTLGGELTGGRGNFGQAFLGQLIGAAVALPLVVLALDQDLLPAAIAAAGTLPLVGAVLGYEIGHADAQTSRVSEPVVAYAAPLRGGALGGVAGRLP